MKQIELSQISWKQPGPAGPGMDISALKAGAEVTVRTRNSTYDMVVLSPREQRVLIRGGNHFKPATEATLLGSSCAEGILAGRIAVRANLSIAANGRGYITSPVKAIENDSRNGSAPTTKQKGRRSMPLQQIFQSVAGGRVAQGDKAVWVCPFGHCRRRIESGTDTELRDRLAIEHFVGHIHLSASRRRTFIAG